MSNMSYCRFENTYSDLEECVQSLRDNEPLSDSEVEYMRQMKELAEELIELADDFKQEEQEDE